MGSRASQGGRRARLTMRSALTHLAKIEKRIQKAKRLALMFDFDGTISPIVPKPEDAYLPAASRRLLKRLNSQWPVCIITGRSLAVIREKVGVPNFIYGASHGLEWSFGNQRHERPVPRKVLAALARVRTFVRKLKARHPKLLLERRRFAVTFHYHLVPRAELPRLEEGLKQLFAFLYSARRLKILWDKKTIDIVPNLQWTKGHIARHILVRLDKQKGLKHLSLYIGDASTDEDAFRALKNGITIRVGKKKGSAAKYYFKSRKQVDEFLSWLSSLVPGERRPPRASNSRGRQN